MTIKEFSYTAQQHFQAQTGQTFKRTHIYELLAASFGYNSFAALCAESVVIQKEYPSTYGLHLNPDIRNRCIDLGYPPATADIIYNKLPTLIIEQRINIVNLLELLVTLNNESPYSDNPTYWDKYEEISAELITGLEAAAEKSNPLAHYALALIHRPEDAPDSWYDHEQQHFVRSITADENQFSDDEKYEYHLREAGRLGNEQALFNLAENFEDPSFFEKAKKDGTVYDPQRVAEIAENLGRIDDAHHWLTIAAELGDINAMRRLIEEFDQNDLMLCWTWMYLAQLLETDLSKDDYHAIHDNGSLYDDDIGGPIYVDGQQGIELRPLNIEQDNFARRSAQKLFDKLTFKTA